MTTFRILIVDDEVLARERLRHLLQQDPRILIVGECGDGPSAMTAIATERPDIVLIDVQLPGCDGPAVVDQLSAVARPEIIFVTAHEQFAVEAFASHAADYLLKPFTPDRLRRAIDRAAELIAMRRANALDRQLERLFPAAPNRRLERLAVKADGRVLLVRVTEIIWIEAANNYCLLHLAGARRLMLREPLASIELRLGPDDFCRINRSALVRLDQVKELQPVRFGDYVVVLHDGTRLPLSRNRRSQLDEWVRNLT